MSMHSLLTRFLLSRSILITVAALIPASPLLADDANTFPSYLNQKYCQDTAAEFMMSSIDSLQSYRDKQLATGHRGGMNNIRQYIDQRRSWLQECDDFLASTSTLRIFRNDDTTDMIFDAMESVNDELRALIAGVSYSTETGGSSTDVAAEKFDRLFRLVDEHKSRLLLRGQLVAR